LRHAFTGDRFVWTACVAGSASALALAALLAFRLEMATPAPLAGQTT